MDPRRDPVRLRLASYPMSHRVPGRFSDIDGYGHLNNVAIASYYEDARATLNRTLFGDNAFRDPRDVSFVVAQVSIQYLAEAHYPAVHEIGYGVSRIGTTSVVHSAGLFRDGVCVGLCDTVLVHLIDRVPTPVPPERRARLETAWFPRPAVDDAAPAPRRSGESISPPPPPVGADAR